MPPQARRRPFERSPLRLGRVLGICGILALVALLLVLQRRIPSTRVRATLRGSVAQQKPVCFVIRTYQQHGSRGSGSLQRILRTLRASELTRWQVLLMVMDSQPFAELHSIVDSFADDRISVYAEQIGPEFSPKKPDGSWNGIYHELLYNLTDLAIRACPANTRWVAITNGDNAYDHGFLEELHSVPEGAAVVAFDYYSRYQRPTGRPCDRFAAGPSLPHCKENKLRFCQTDLGANVLDWRRFVAEKRAFGAMPSLGFGLNDGYMAEAVVTDGWKVHRVTARCLFSHSPSPQVCALKGGVWDDSRHGKAPVSGCLDSDDALTLLAGRGGQDVPLEITDVHISNDGASFGMAGRGDTLLLRCIRPAGEASGEKWVNTYFPPACAATVDGGAP